MQSNLLHKIMYIEDERDIITIVQLALVDLGGFTLECCTSGKEALRIAPEFNPDLFLIDVMLPEMDGPTILKNLRQIPKFSNTPIIFITAKTQSHEIKEFYKLGVIDVITKPFDPLKLSDIIRSAWQKNQTSGKE